MKHALALLILFVLGAAGLAAHQWSQMLARIDQSRWQFEQAGDSPLFAEEIIPRALQQPLLGGKAHLNFFLRLWRSERDQAAAVSARLFIPAHAWADLLFHDRAGRRSAFRLSRSPGMMSGFLRWDGDHLVASHEVSAPAGTVVPEAELGGAQRQELMIWSFNQPREALAEMERSGTGRWFEIGVLAVPQGLEAQVDGQTVGFWPGADLSGPVGVGAGDLPSLYADWIEATGPAGTVLWREDFSPSRQSFMLVISYCLLYSTMALIAWWLVLRTGVLLSHDLDRGRFALRLSRGLWPLAVVPLLGWWWGPVESIVHLRLWWLAAGLLSALLWLGAFLSARNQFRWRVPRSAALRAEDVFFARWSAAPNARGPRLSEALLIAALMALLPLISFLWSARSEPPPTLFRHSLTPKARILREGEMIHSSRTTGRDGARLEARLRLLDPGTAVELYLLQDARDFYSPEEAVRDWYALRLSDDPAKCGLVVSDRPLRHPDLSPLTLGQEVSAEIAIDAARVVARLSSGEAGTLKYDELRDRRFTNGGAGLVVRSGRAEVIDLTLHGASPVATAQLHGWQRLRGWWRANPSQFLCMIVGAALMLWLLSTMALSLAGSLPPQGILRFSGLAWLIALAVGALVYQHLWSHEMKLTRGYSLSLALGVTLLAVAALHHLIWAIHFGQARRFQIVSALLLLAGLAGAEHVIRATPLNYDLQSRQTTGYLRSQFVFGGLEVPHLWMTYTGGYHLPYRGIPGWDEHVPIAKRAGELRVFCMGGSSTWGAGVRDVEQSYPWMLEKILKPQWPDVNVINAGYPSYTIFQDLLYLRRDILRLKPDVITLYIGANDGYLSWWSGGPLEETWRATNALADAGPLQRALLWLARQRLFVGLTRIADSLRGFPARLHVMVPPERFEANLREFAEICREHGVGLVLMHEVMVEDLHLQDSSHAAYHEILDRVGRELDLPVLDPRPQFRHGLFNNWLIDPVHPSATGNRVLARLLAPAVSREIAVGGEPR